MAKPQLSPEHFQWTRINENKKMCLFTSTGRSGAHSNKTATYSLYFISFFFLHSTSQARNTNLENRVKTISPAEVAPNLRAKPLWRQRNATGNLSVSTAVSLHSLHCPQLSSAADQQNGPLGPCRANDGGKR